MANRDHGGGVDNDFRDGIWGGLTVDERARARVTAD
jgi:hypothetical protein